MCNEVEIVAEYQDDASGNQGVGDSPGLKKLLVSAERITPIPRLASAGFVKIIHGANGDIFNVAGAFVARVRESLVHAFNIPDDAIAFINGEMILADYRLQVDDTLEFVKQWGCKGADENPLDRPLTVKEAAAELRCSISFVYKLMREGELSYEKRGRRKLPLLMSVQEYRGRNVIQALLPPQADRHAPGPRRYKHLFN